MLYKLALRNAKRSSKDYFIYFTTMTAVAAMMFSFDSMLFSKDVWKMFENAGIMAAMMGIVTIFIIFIVAWLINYMARFMLQKRSREFGTYLLIGMERKKISKLYILENMFIGTASFLLGIVAGLFLQQILMSIFYRFFDMGFSLNIELNVWSMLMTTGCYYISFIIALINNKKSFKKMTISEMMKIETKEIKLENHTGIKQILVVFALVYMIYTYVAIFRGSSAGKIFMMLVGFIFAIYIMFYGLSAFIVRRVEKKSNIIYRNNNLFVLRQFSAKVKSMHFTMGTLTFLLIFALLGGSIAIMFQKTQAVVIDYTMPFDVLEYGNVPDEDFSQELNIMEETCGLNSYLVYNIYVSHDNLMNRFMYTRVPVSLDYTKGESSKDEFNYHGEYREYYEYDTYMRLSDYNTLRKMLGYEEITMDNGTYIVHTKERLKDYLEDDIQNQEFEVSGQRLEYGGLYTEAFSQNGLNGADYVLVIDDELCEQLTKYYSLLAADLNGKADSKLNEEITRIFNEKYDLKKSEDLSMLRASGTDQLMIFTANLIVRDVYLPEMKFIILSIVFPLAYIGFIFIFAALTVLSVQQLSDSAKYSFRYNILSKLGVSERALKRIVRKQLALYYMLPAVSAVAMSIIAIVSIGNAFEKYTAVNAGGWYFFGVSMLIFIGVYIIYYAATYVTFIKNIKIAGKN